MDATAPARADGLWDAPDWYRALSLTERLGPRPIVGPSVSSGADTVDERALARLRAWKEQRPFEHDSLFAQRLALDGLSEQDLLVLLAEPADSLKARSAGVPNWLAALRQAFTEERLAGDLPAMLEALASDHPLAACLPALGPLLQHGLSSLEGQMQVLQRRYPFTPFDVEALPRAFLGNIVNTILFQVSKPLILEMNIARLQGRLHGETPEARFEDFMCQLRRDGAVVAFLRKYPVLARQLVITIDQWAAFLGEVLTHLCTDWPEICRTFAPGATDRLVDVEAGKGDRHRGGRSVLVLRFGSGMRLVYKPKPLGADVHFEDLLSWLNERGATPALHGPKLLDRGGYGWSEFVAPSSCASEEEVARFYERLGGYLAVLYALDAADLHNENLIAAGEHPMLVDLEALFHPHVYESHSILAANLAAGALDESVWQVGILPRRVWADEESLGVDMSGVGGGAGQMNPHALVSWNEAGSDEMRLRRRRAELPVSENRPQLHGEYVDVLDYRDAFVDGFTRMYHLLCEHRDALLSERLPRFAGDEIRVVVRSTNVYGLLWYESFHSDLLRDALDRDRYFDRLWGEAAHRRHLARVIAAERRDLLRGDIPAFSTVPHSRALLTSDGRPIEDFLDAPSLNVVRQRLQRLGDDDLATQTWIVAASLATLLMAREGGMPRPSRLPPRSVASVEPQRLLSLADAVGDRLGDLALWDDAAANWLGVSPLDESTWGVLPSGIDLYAGTGGIALFLAYLGAIGCEASHTLLARRALASLRMQVQGLPSRTDEEHTPSASLPTVGGFDGLGSLIYVLTNLGVLWGEPDLLREAAQLVERLPPLIARDERLDVVYGSAGCILSLLSLHSVDPSPRTLEVAVRCGDHLRATAQPMARGVAWTTLEGEQPLGGFSHGASGIAYSLLRLAARSGHARFREMALEALEFDRSLFVPELNNWADLRVFPNRRLDPDTAAESTADASVNSMVAWCHGASGIGLARLAALPELDDARVREEIEIALTATRDLGFAINHSLCHGALGNAELLLVAARVLDRPEHRTALERATTEIAASIESNGWVTGVPLGVETPGFMTGLAGIGYGLLRQAEPDKVPSVLLLAAPTWRAPG
jgi:type 2 lantibiotic biosynthesis protein LanM